MRMAREECFSFLVVFMPGQLGAGIQRAAFPGWAATSWLSVGTEDPVLSPPPPPSRLHMQVLQALREAVRAAQSSLKGPFLL